MDFLLVVAMACGDIATVLAAIGGTIDALGRPRAAWPLAGYRRSRWVWQAAAVPLLPLALVCVCWYQVRVRPRLVAAECRLAAASRSPAAPLVSPPAAREVTIRMSLAFVTLLAAAPVIGVVVGTVAAGGFVPQFPLVPGLVVVAVVAAGLGLRVTRDRLVLQPGGLRIYSTFRTKVVPWIDVVAIEVRETLGSRHVRVLTATGRAYRLRVPITLFGLGRSRFGADCAHLRQWWRTYAPGAA